MQVFGKHNMQNLQAACLACQQIGIEADDFYTDRERDNLDDVDPIAIREALAQRGIVNGELVDPAALERDPFIQQVTADAERIAQEEQEPALEQAKSLINDFCRSEY